MARYLSTLLATLWLFSHHDLGAEIVELKNATSLDTKLMVGGSVTNISNFPFQFAIYTGNNFKCAGSILSENWAITAGHCVDLYPTQPKHYTIRIGSSYHAIYGRVIRISSIHLHPSYDRLSLSFDVALLNISGHGLSNDFVQPIKLPAAQAPIPVGMHLNISGWGETEHNPVSHILQYATVKVIDQNNCAKAYGNRLEDNMFCASAPGKDACKGDSGGAIQVDNVLYGIISWADGCARPNAPGVYTRLAFPKIRHWIHSITGL